MPGTFLYPYAALGLFSVFLALLFFVCGYVLGRRGGALAATGVLLLPGCLNMLSLWPKIAFLPDAFSIGATGVAGAPLGFLPLLALGLVLGWCVTILLADLLSLGDRFGHLYDHLWCAAVLVAVFFDARHYRWIYYVFFSLVVGGKIATSTMKLFSMGQRSGTQARRVVCLIRRTATIIGAGWGLVKRGCARIWSASSRLAAKTWAAVPRPRAKARVVSRPRSQRPVRRRV